MAEHSIAVASSPGSRIGQKRQRWRGEEKAANARTFRYPLVESVGTKLSIEQTTLGEGTSSSTVKKLYKRREAEDCPWIRKCHTIRTNWRGALNNS